MSFFPNCSICDSKIGYFDEKYVFRDGTICKNCAHKYFPYVSPTKLSFWTQINSVQIVKEAKEKNKIIKLENGKAVLLDPESNEAAPINNQNTSMFDSFLDNWQAKRKQKAKIKEQKQREQLEVQEKEQKQHELQVQTWKTEDLSKRAAKLSDGAEFGIALKKNEYCYLAIPELINWKEERTKTQRVNYSGLTASVHIAKGFNYRMGSIKPETQKVNYLVTLFTGALFLTNKRIILLTRDSSKAYMLSRALRAVAYDDGTVLYSNSGKKVILDGFSNAEQFNIYLNRLLTEEDVLPKEEKTSKANSSRSTHTNSAKSTPQKNSKQSSPYDELRELKSLLDDGVITQDDFDKKKKEILGL